MRRPGLLACVCWLAAVCAVPAQEVTPRDFRLFLTDGTEIATHGEASRVGDEVVAMVPVGIGHDASGPALQAVTLPAGRIDWPRTEAYLEAVRLAQYMAARGDRDYEAFTAEVAAALDRVAALPDPLARIATVEAVRRQLAVWPREHYGYRRDEATAMLSMLDEVLIGLRAAAGQREFTLALTSTPAAVPPAPPPLRGAPTLQDVVSQALGLAAHVVNPSERETLLARALASVAAEGAGSDGRWRRDITRQLERRLGAERRATRDYAALRSRVIGRAERLATAADVRALMALRADTMRRDDRLGHQRPGDVAALLAHLDDRLDAARQRRLVLDRWEARRPALAAYQASMSGLLRTASPVREALDDIRTLSGPPLDELDRAASILAGVEVTLRQVQAPDEGLALHGLMASGIQMAGNAVARRRAATLSGNLAQAWEASAAAAGALLVFDRLDADLAQLARPPAEVTAVASASR